MRVRLVSLASGSVAFFVSHTALSSPLPPVKAWGVDYGDTQCTAVNSFGNADSPIVLGIVPSIGGETFRWVVSVPHAGPPSARNVDATVKLGGTSMKKPLLYFGKAGVKMSIYQLTLTAAEMEPARTAPSFVIHASNGTSFDLATPDMSSVLDALKKCTADLQQYWNMNVELAKGPRLQGKDPRGAFSADDYPSEALMRGLGGTSQFRLLVDDKGAVAGCDVLRASGVPVLDVMGCQVMQERLKFDPAADAKGQAQRTVVTTPPVTWRVDGGFQLEGPTLTGGQTYKG